MAKLVKAWPSLPYMSLGLWTAWSSLACSGSMWLSDTEVDGTNLSVFYIVSTFACAAILLIIAAFAKKGLAESMLDRRVVTSGGILAAVGGLIVILVGPYYLGSYMHGFESYLFWFASALTGVGTGMIGMRCGVLYGSLPPRRALAYAALSQLVSCFVYLFVFACPRWQLVAHGPATTDILFFILLPMAAAFLACAPASNDDHSLVEVDVVPPETFSLRDLPSTFWRFALFGFVMALTSTLMRSTVVTTHALASTIEGNSLLMVLRTIMAGALIAYSVADCDRGEGFGRVCSVLAAFSAAVMMCVAALGGLTNEWSLMVYFASSVLDVIVWCLLAFIVAQKHVSAVVVFGWGRGLFTLGCSMGWTFGSNYMTLVDDGPGTTIVYVVAASAMLVLALGLFSKRDYERLFSPVTEEELSLEDLFDRETLEVKYSDSSKAGDRRGRFSRAVDDIAERSHLSAREADILRYLAMGYGSDRIATTLEVKVNTVRTHTHNVYVKLGVHSREELMRLVDEAVARPQACARAAKK